MLNCDVPLIHRDIGYKTGYDMYQDVKPYMDNRPLGVEVHCFHGSCVPTIDKYVFDPLNIDYKHEYNMNSLLYRIVYKGVGSFPCKHPIFQTGDGDGTVNIRSLEGYTQWITKQKEKVCYQVLPNVNHFEVLTDARVIDYILKLVVKQ